MCVSERENIIKQFKGGVYVCTFVCKKVCACVCLCMLNIKKTNVYRVQEQYKNVLCV